MRSYASLLFSLISLSISGSCRHAFHSPDIDSAHCTRSSSSSLPVCARYSRSGVLVGRVADVLEKKTRALDRKAATRIMNESICNAGPDSPNEAPSCNQPAMAFPCKMEARIFDCQSCVLSMKPDAITYDLSSRYFIKCDIRDLATSTPNLNKTHGAFVMTEDIGKAGSNRIYLLYGCLDH
jgi:hypothetical protein